MRRGITIGIVWLILLVLVVFGAVWLFKTTEEPEKVPVIEEIVIEEPVVKRVQETIGTSVEGRGVEVVRYGNGSNHLLFVGGIHGGYEWNSVLLAYEFIDYFDAHPELVPEDVTLSIIPSANPDGVYEVIQKEGRFVAIDIPADADIAMGRFNSNNVDLNRNFDCKWKPESMWRGNVVSAGTSAFSEPEAVAIRDYVLKNSPKTVVFWHSKANAVYASECEKGVLPATLNVMNIYSTASSYKPVPVFDAYEITGDAEGWLASIGIPAVTVELETRDSIEWEKNLNGVLALIESASVEFESRSTGEEIGAE